MDSIQQFQDTSDVIIKNSKESMTTTQEGHIVHFTLGSQSPLQSTSTQLVVNIPTNATTTALPLLPPPTAVNAATDAIPAVKMIDPIPYNGKYILSISVHHFFLSILY